MVLLQFKGKHLTLTSRIEKWFWSQKCIITDCWCGGAELCVYSLNVKSARQSRSTVWCLYNGLTHTLVIKWNKYINNYSSIRWTLNLALCVYMQCQASESFHLWHFLILNYMNLKSFLFVSNVNCAGI